MSFPGWSAGCDLPAKRICTGRLELRSSLPSRVRSRSSRFARLYGAKRQPKGGVRRAQALARVAGSLPAKVHEAVEGDPDLGEVGTQLVPHETGVEIVAAGRDRGVGREDDAGPGDQAGLLERHLA